MAIDTWIVSLMLAALPSLCHAACRAGEMRATVHQEFVPLPVLGYENLWVTQWKTCRKGRLQNVFEPYVTCSQFQWNDRESASCEGDRDRLSASLPTGKPGRHQ